MIVAMRNVMLRLLSPLWRTANEDEDGGSPWAGQVVQAAAVTLGSITPDISVTETVRDLREGVVTRLCQDYGMIDDAIYFTDAVVLGGSPLRVGDRVTAIAVRDGFRSGWKALRVELLIDTWENEAGSGPKTENRLKRLIGTVTSCDQDGGFINQTTFFPYQALCQGYEPMKGDWVQAQYFINPTEWCSQAHLVWPLRYCRMDQVRVTRLCGRSGVADDSVFFSLDSLLLPSGFVPRLGDVVNVVVLESRQSLYSWRALCMAPVQPGSNPEPPVTDVDLQELLENKGGLLVDGAQFGSLLLGETRELPVWIDNQGSEMHILCCCELVGWDPQRQFTLGHVTPATGAVMDGNICEENGPSAKGVEEENLIREQRKDIEISPGGRLSITVSCKAKNLGRCSELLLLHFPNFTIGRRMDVMVSSMEEELLQPSAPYSPAIALAKKHEAHMVTVQAIPRLRLPKRHLPNFLKNYPVPKALRDCVEAKGDVLVAQPSLAELLSLDSVQPRFSALLWLEELQAENELQAFSLSCVPLRRGTEYLHLEVPGVAEGRPSVFVGNKVLLKKPLSGGVVVEYVAYVMEIIEEDLSLRVNSEFQQEYLGEPLDVEFTFNRLTMRRCHCALEQVRTFGESVLFPSVLVLQPALYSGPWDQEEAVKEEDSSRKHKNVPTLDVDMVSVAPQTKSDPRMQCTAVHTLGCFFNPQLNPAQREAVKRILAAECRPTPYTLFGPPGTGKTVTLVEAILQVYHCLPGSRVLVCTPSNTAADLICLRLHNSGFLHTASLVRINATSRPEESISDVLRPYCQAGEDVRQASFYRIVVSTCSSAAMLYQVGLRVGHFTHVFIDEAGQATEPETLIPLGLMSEVDGQIVLAGDPHQLGPVVKSQHAEVFGLGVSLLERLMKRPLYSRGKNGYNPLLVTKLVYNYRCHEALLALPSQLFYGGELCARAERAVVDTLCNWSRLPTKGFPVIFHGVRGKEMREGTNPSWFNPVEAVQIMFYCCQLAKRVYHPISVTDIGVITPYRKQVETIRRLLHMAGLGEVKVGSVEEFQGQESLVVLLSMVRANESAFSEDTQGVLGFLSNPKRFNVAITRAKALLIIVGNPHVLVKDLCFRALLQYCFENGAFLGCDPPPCLRAPLRAATGDHAN